MIRWTPTRRAPPLRRWQSREEIVKGRLDSLSPDELRRVRPDYYWLRFGYEAWKHNHERKANFDPNQPRVPANNPGGGRWTRPGGVQVTTSDGFLTGISTIDDTSQALSDTLVGVMEMIDFMPDSTPQLYGMAVHSLFAASVRLQGLPGIGFWDVERTFSLEDIDPRYGLTDSVRTDVVLRNDQGEIIAIYDVKTGDQPLSHARADELRTKTRAASNTPVFELNIVRGITRKNARTTSYSVCRALCRY